jgi:hypothetical protein
VKWHLRIAIEFRWAKGDYGRLLALAADLVNRRVNVLTDIGGDPSALAAQRAASFAAPESAPQRRDQPRASALVGAGLTASCGNGPIRALKDGRKHGQELLRRKLLFLVQWRVAEEYATRFPGVAQVTTGRDG